MNLIHGDCLDKLRDIPTGSVDMVLADLPYGTTACKWDNVIPFEPLWKELHRVCKPSAAMCMFGSEPFSSHMRMSNIKNFKYDWVWVKENGTGFLNAKKQPLRNAESISVFYKGTPNYMPIMRMGLKPYSCSQGKTKTENYGKQTGAVTVSNGERYPLTTIEFKRDKNKDHPTQKPVALLEYLIKTYTLEGETVLDPTMGSGSTGVACRNLGRNFIGIEQDEKYFSVATQRINQAQP